MQNERRRIRDDGFILYAVLGVVALLSAMFVATSLLVRGAADNASVAALAVAEDALLGAGRELAGYQLFVLGLPASRIDDQEIRLNGGTVALTAQPEAGFIDLNGADRTLLMIAYRLSGLNTMSPEMFAARVIDWRDDDEITSPGGGEAGDYAAAGLRYGPANRAFNSVDELKALLGVSATDVSSLRPYLTVFNPGGRLDVFSVSTQILAALPGMDEAKAGQAAAARDGHDDAALDVLKGLLGQQAQFMDFDKPAAYRVVLVAKSVKGGTSTANAVLIKSANPSVAYQVVDWQQ